LGRAAPISRRRRAWQVGKRGNSALALIDDDKHQPHSTIVSVGRNAACDNSSAGDLVIAMAPYWPLNWVEKTPMYTKWAGFYNAALRIWRRYAVLPYVFQGDCSNEHYYG